MRLSFLTLEPAYVQSFPLEPRMSTDSFGERRVAGNESRIDLPTVEDAVEECLLRGAEREDGFEPLPALFEELPRPGIRRIPHLVDAIPEEREKLILELADVEVGVGRLHRPPVLPAHRPIDDERDAQPLMLQLPVGEEAMGVEE